MNPCVITITLDLLVFMFKGRSQTKLTNSFMQDNFETMMK